MSARRIQTQRGAALLLAMLTVTLVASLSAAALWQQWRTLAVETAERQRQQAGWVLSGALDWARLILREDAIANNSQPVDHLAEPWALPLAEARLSSFLAADASQSADITLQAFLSGDIVDLQGRLNLDNLVSVTAGSATAGGGTPQVQVSEADRRAFERLFELLGLPPAELQTFITQLSAAKAAQNGVRDGDAPLMPARWGQLGWLGLSPRSLALLAPHATWLPGRRVALNLNTASAEALFAALDGIDMAQARQMLDQRASSHFKDLADAKARFPQLADALNDSQRLGTRSNFFQIRGRLRLDDLQVEELALIERGVPNANGTRPVWRERRAPEWPTATAGAAGVPTRSLQ